MANRIKELREAAGLSERTLCEAADITRPTLILAQADMDRVRIETLAKIARALGVPLRELAPERAEEVRELLAAVS